MDWWIVILVLGELGLFALILAIVLTARHRRARLRSEERFRLIERFESPDELARFMESPNGARFLGEFAAKEPDPRRKVLFVIGLGIVMMAVGVAFVLLSLLSVGGEREAFLIPGVLCSLGGGGFLTAGFTAAFLSRRWRFSEPPAPSRPLFPGLLDPSAMAVASITAAVFPLRLARARTARGSWSVGLSRGERTTNATQQTDDAATRSEPTAEEPGWSAERFERFHADTATGLWRYVRQLVGRATEADDVVQESYLRLLQRADPARPDAALRAYLYRIATNLVRDQWRRTKTARTFLSPTLDDDDPYPEPAARAVDPARSLDFWPVFGRLTERDRALLWLGHVEGWAHREIGQGARFAYNERPGPPLSGEAQVGAPTR